MSLLSCPECGHEVSSYADRCMNCGFPRSYLFHFGTEKIEVFLIVINFISQAGVFAMKLIGNDKYDYSVKFDDEDFYNICKYINLYVLSNYDDVEFCEEYREAYYDYSYKKSQREEREQAKLQREKKKKLELEEKNEYINKHIGKHVYIEGAEELNFEQRFALASYIDNNDHCPIVSVKVTEDNKIEMLLFEDGLYRRVTRSI